MKVPAAALAALLLMAICSPAEAHSRPIAESSQKPDTVPIQCCFSYLVHPIRSSFITSAYRTSSSCSQPAVILVTRKGREVCVNPKAPWVQKYLNQFQMLDY